MNAREQRIGRALRRLRWTGFRNTVRGLLVGSRLRVVLVAIFSLVFWFGLFLIFRDGFRFLSHHKLISGPLIELLFQMFFASLLVMLVFSTGIILYASLFASREAEYLLATPTPSDRVFGHKFQEAMFFSSWGFLLLGSPLVTAYGTTTSAPAVYYLLAALFFVAFAMIPGAVGALVCLAVTNFLPRRRAHVLVAAGVAVLALLAWKGFSIWRSLKDPERGRTWINQFLEETTVSSLFVVPSEWITRGLLSSTYQGGLEPSLFYLAVLLANALFGYLLATASYRWLYRRGYDRVHSEVYARKRRTGTYLPRIVERLFAPLPRGVRILIQKDLRVFARDPLQWSQALIFTGLLGFYFLNLGRMTYYTTSPYWRNLIGFFNLAVTGLLLSTYTSRFIYPLLSLEGQKFWILGLCPISREAILWGKFAFACGGALLVTVVLTLIGAWTLALSPLLIALQILVVVILCFGLSAIAVGLGARFPDLKQTDPSKIAAGFGGTLNLVASLVFILIVVGTMALPCHLYAVTLTLSQGGDDAGLLAGAAGLSLEQFRFWLGVSIVFNVLFGALATWLPMRLGVRAFKSMEF